MECSVCMEAFDLEARRPKSLPCGHTFCLECLQNPAINNLCPRDRQAFQGDPVTLLDNCALLEVVAEARAKGVWCEFCRRQYGAECADAGHRPYSDRQRQAAQHQLGAGVAELRREFEELRKSVQQPGLGVARLRREFEELRAAVLQPGRGVAELRRALEEFRREFEELRKSVQQPGPGVAELRRELEELRKSVQQPGPGVAELRRELEEFRREFEELRKSVQQPEPVVAELRRELEELRKSKEQPGPGVAELRRDLQEMHRQVQELRPRAAQPPTRLELDIKELSSTRRLRRDRNNLLLGGKLTQVRTLTGLDCGVDVAWAEAVLLKVGPHIEELHATNVDVQHLRAIQGMTALKKLHLECYTLDEFAELPLLPLQLEDLTIEEFGREHLLSLQWMPKLRDLYLIGYGDISLSFSPMPGHCGVRRMTVGFFPTPTLLSLVRAHAASLEVLYVNIPSSSVYDGWMPDFGRRLHECGLVALTELVLFRDYNQHDGSSCRVQLRAFRARFGPDVVVRCSVCTQ